MKSVASYVSRHRHKIVSVVVLSGVIYFINLRLRSVSKALVSKQAVQARTQVYFDKAQRSCDAATLSLIPKYSERLSSLIDLPASSQLRTIEDKEQKIAMWDRFKILTFTRTLSGVYGLVLLALHIRVQVNLVGRYLYLDSMMNGDTHHELEPAFPSTTQKRYLAFAEYLLQDGLRGLVAFIQDSAETVVGPISLTHQLSYDDVLVIILIIRRSIESKLDRLLESLLPSEKEDFEKEDPKLTMLLSETRNILEGTSFRSTLKQCLDRAFLHFTRNLRLSFVPDAQHTSSDHEDDKSLSMPTPLVEMAMAKLLPCINKQYSFALQSPQNEIMIALSSFEPLQNYNYSVFTTP